MIVTLSNSKIRLNDTSLLLWISLYFDKKTNQHKAINEFTIKLMEVHTTPRK